jgi:EAL domain-containing protein (putative c-di-GMP-specific phosphodiesterase class I)
LSLNISPRQFERADLCERIAAILEETGLPFERVEIEITESVLMDQKDAAAKLRQLRALGLRISIDDFGTGHSSLAYLKHFPIDKLKLDRAFIHDIPSDATGMEIAAAVIGLGHSLDVEVLAEGVETEAQADFLVRSGCRLAQGFLFGRPMWEEDLLATLAQDCSKAA